MCISHYTRLYPLKIPGQSRFLLGAVPNWVKSPQATCQHFGPAKARYSAPAAFDREWWEGEWRPLNAVKVHQANHPHCASQGMDLR